MRNFYKKWFLYSAVFYFFLLLFASGVYAQVADTTPPVRLNGTPTGVLLSGTTQTIISLLTDENAVCKYGTISQRYSSIPNTFTTINGLFHSATVTGLSDGVTYTYYIRCQDSFNNVNNTDYQISFSVATITSDVTPPSIPAGLSATTVSSSQIDLSWTASTDDIGVAGYKVYRNGAQIATTTATTYSNIGLLGSTIYSYAVSAYDAAGNNSSQSALVSATTAAAPIADTTSPSDPTSLTAAVISSSQINLSWTASTDNVGVAGYKIYRNSIQIAAVNTGLTYSDNGLQPNTVYSYQVAAYDAAGNTSQFSTSVSATTSAVAISLSCADAYDYTDSTYGGKIRELVRPSGHEHNFYYHRNVFNANNTYMILIRQDPDLAAPYDVSLYTADGCFIKKLFSSQYNWRITWDRNDPNYFYTISNNQLFKYDVNTNQAQMLKAFASPLGIAVVNGSSLNQAGDRIGLLVKDINTQIMSFRSYHLPDMSDERITPITFPAGCVSDWEDERYIGYQNYFATGCVSSNLTVVRTYIYDDTGTLFHEFIGDNPNNIAKRKFSFGHSDFSPDGKFAYLMMWGQGEPLKIHVVNIDGSNDQALYSIPQSQAFYIQNFHISWPDKISDWFVAGLFPTGSYLPASYSPPLDELIQINVKDKTFKYLARTGTQTKIPFNNFWAQSLPSPSADGSRIAFDSTCANTTSTIPTPNCVYTGTMDAYILYTGVAPSPIVTPPTVSVIPPGASSGTSGGMGFYPSPVQTPSTPTTEPSASQPQLAFTPLKGPFGIGQKSEEIKTLQQMMAQDSAIYPSNKISGSYDADTIEAVKKFQIKYNIVSSGSPDTTGFGLAGPKTREKLNELYAGKLTTAVSGQEISKQQIEAQIKQLQELLMSLLQQLLEILIQKTKNL